MPDGVETSSRWQSYSLFNSSRTSSGSGNLPVAFLLKISLPFAVTSKTPPLPSMSFGVIFKFFLIVSARLTARGL